jgi:hypothetical protein
MFWPKLFLNNKNKNDNKNNNNNRPDYGKINITLPVDFIRYLNRNNDRGNIASTWYIAILFQYVRQVKYIFYIYYNNL